MNASEKNKTLLANQKRLTTPNWMLWKRLKSVTLGEALLLSQNLCPHTYYIGGDFDFTEKIKNNIHLILMISINHLENTGTDWATSQISYPIDANKLKVDFEKYFAWLSKNSLLKANIKRKIFGASHHRSTKPKNISETNKETEQAREDFRAAKSPANPTWELKHPKRHKVTYSIPLTEALEHFHKMGGLIPSAVDIAKYWKENNSIKVDLIKKRFTYNTLVGEITSDFKNLNDSIKRRITKLI